MVLEKLSQNGYYCRNVFSNKTIEDLLALCQNFSGNDIHDVRGNPELGVRQVSMLSKSCPDIEKVIINNIEKQVKEITPDFSHIYGLELWRDYKGWINPLHKDCLEAQNIMIVYLDDRTDLNGTMYIENDLVITAQYKQNTALILLNSDTITHGMSGTVTEIRHCLYISWITKTRRQLLALQQ